MIYNINVIESKSNFPSRTPIEIQQLLIDLRRSREPCFGVQTIFASIIDRLDQNLGAEADEKGMNRQDPPVIYHIRYLFS